MQLSLADEQRCHWPMNNDVAEDDDAEVTVQRMAMLAMLLNSMMRWK
jgi:hypothetical protein